MKNEISNQMVTEQSHKPRKSKSFEEKLKVSADHRHNHSVGNRHISVTPSHRREPVSPFSETRKPQTQLDDSKSAKENPKPLIGGSMRYTESSESAKENHKPVIGGSMRYTGRFEFLGQSNSSVSSKYVSVMRRAPSLTAKTQWALSPGRRESPTMSVETKGVPMSFSSMKPPTSPSKTKGVEKLLNLGLELFKSKKSSNSSAVLVKSKSVSSASNITETGHQLRLLHNRLMQWRYANGRAGVVNENIAKKLQANVLYAWDGLTKLRHSVVQKKLKLEKEKLDMKLNSILQVHSQLKSLESWGDTERQHMAAVSLMKECLHSVVCRVPLTEGAEVDTQSAAIALRHASDLTTSVKLLLATFSLLAEQTAPLLSQLAEVVAQEKLLLEECRELLRTISTLEIEERSLKSSIIQLEYSWKQEQL